MMEQATSAKMTKLLVVFCAACGGLASQAMGQDEAGTAAQSVNEVATSSGIGVARPSCEDWNTWEFFESSVPETIVVCLREGADPHALDYQRQTPLHRAALTNDNVAVTEALLEAGADPSARLPTGHTPLHMAAIANDNVVVVEALLEAGADPHAQDDYGGTPLLRGAGSNDNVAVIEALLEAGADPNAQAQNGETPLLQAARFNENVAVTEALLEAGADPHGRGRRRCCAQPETTRMWPRLRPCSRRPLIPMCRIGRGRHPCCAQPDSTITWL